MVNNKLIKDKNQSQKTGFQTVHLSNLNNYHRRFENAQILRDPVKIGSEKVWREEEFTCRDAILNRSKSRGKVINQLGYQIPREQLAIHRCTNKELVIFEKNQEERIFQRQCDVQIKNSIKNVELGSKPVVREDKIKMMQRLAKQQEEQKKKRMESRSKQRLQDNLERDRIIQKELRLESYAKKIKELEKNWEIIEQVEDELDNLNIIRMEYRNEVIQHVGMQILSMLLDAVKQRDNVVDVAIDDKEMERNEERIRKEVEKKAIAEVKKYSKIHATRLITPLIRPPADPKQQEIIKKLAEIIDKKPSLSESEFQSESQSDSDQEDKTNIKKSKEVTNDHSLSNNQKSFVNPSSRADITIQQNTILDKVNKYDHKAKSEILDVEKLVFCDERKPKTNITTCDFNEDNENESVFDFDIKKKNSKISALSSGSEYNIQDLEESKSSKKDKKSAEKSKKSSMKKDNLPLYIDYTYTNPVDLFEELLPNSKVAFKIFKMIHYPCLMAYDIRQSVLLISASDQIFKLLRNDKGELIFDSQHKLGKIIFIYDNIC